MGDWTLQLSPCVRDAAANFLFYLQPTFTLEQWRPKPKGRQLFWIHRREGLWPIVAIMHRMFTFAIEQSELLRLCVYVCVCVCVCARASPRWRHGGHEVAGEDSNFGRIHAEVAHFLQMEGAVRVRGTRRASDTAPHWRRVPLLSWVRPQYHQDQQFSASLDLHSSVPPYHHTPWGLSSWQSDRSTLTASSGYGDR